MHIRTISKRSFFSGSWGFGKQEERRDQDATFFRHTGSSIQSLGDRKIAPFVACPWSPREPRRISMKPRPRKAATGRMRAGKRSKRSRRNGWGNKASRRRRSSMTRADKSKLSAEERMVSWCNLCRLQRCHQTWRKNDRNTHRGVGGKDRDNKREKETFWKHFFPHAKNVFSNYKLVARFRCGELTDLSGFFGAEQRWI